MILSGMWFRFAAQAGPVDSENLHERRRRGMAFFPRAFARLKLAAGLVFFLTGTIFLFASLDGITLSATNALSAGSLLDPKYGVGNWIWAAEVHDQQTCRFWKQVDIPKGSSVKQAIMAIAADDDYHLFVDGRDIGQGTLWYDLAEYDLTQILGPGRHIIAVECFNAYLEAGLVAGLRVQLRDGRAIEVPTDSSWRIVPNDEKNWTARREADPSWVAATVEAKFGEGTWTRHEVHIFLLPPIEPIIVPFSQTALFRNLMFSTCAVLAALCLWLVGKLAVNTRAQQVVRRERARIARDIHDDLTAGLTQLVLFGEVAQRELPEGSEAHRHVAKVCAKARSLSLAMDEIIWLVNSQRDTFRDFRSYVCNYAETFLDGTPVLCRFDVEDETFDFPCDLGVRRSFFLAVKEALSNVVRHSGASEMILRIHGCEQQMIVVIEDNGKGFDPALASRPGNGLSNMKTRAAEVGGVCRIISRPGAGCCVEFRVPRRATGPSLKFWRRRPSAQVQILRANPEKTAP
jgi:two-component sensor histidine kinase